MHWQINIPQTDTEIDWDTVKGVDVPQFTDEEAAQLRELLASIARAESNPTFPEFLIPKYREWARADSPGNIDTRFASVNQRVDDLEPGTGIPSGAAVLISGQITQTT